MKKIFTTFGKGMLATFILTTAAFASSEMKAADLMAPGELVWPNSPYTTYLEYEYVELSWDYDYIELVEPSEETSSYGNVLSNIPVTVQIEGVEGEFEMYPYIYNEVFLGYDDEDEEIYGYVLELDFYDADLGSQLPGGYLPYGKYTFSYPEGIVKNALGEINPAQQVIIYYYEGTDYDSYEFNPPAYDSGYQAIDYAADDLSEVSLTWNLPMTKNPDSDNISVLKYVSLMEQTPYAELIYGEDVNINSAGDALVFDLSFVPVGRWQVVVPIGYVFLGEDSQMINDEAFANYTVTTPSGISDMVESEAGQWVVYDLKGVLVLNTSDKAQLSNLNPGLYIINGQKVFIKK